MVSWSLILIHETERSRDVGPALRSAIIMLQVVLYPQSIGCLE